MAAMWAYFNDLINRHILVRKFRRRSYVFLYRPPETNSYTGLLQRYWIKLVCNNRSCLAGNSKWDDPSSKSRSPWL